jgi:hypothetical protein
MHGGALHSPSKRMPSRAFWLCVGTVLIAFCVGLIANGARLRGEAQRTAEAEARETETSPRVTAGILAKLHVPAGLKVVPCDPVFRYTYESCLRSAHPIFLSRSLALNDAGMSALVSQLGARSSAGLGLGPPCMRVKLFAVKRVPGERLTWLSCTTDARLHSDMLAVFLVSVAVSGSGAKDAGTGLPAVRRGTEVRVVDEGVQSH